MLSKLIFEREGLRTYALVYEKGDEFITLLRAFAEEHQLGVSHFTAIGALKHAVIGFFDREKMDYLKVPIKEQVEVLSLTGNITLSDEGYKSMRTRCSARLTRAPSEATSTRLMSGPRWKLSLKNRPDICAARPTRKRV